MEGMSPRFSANEVTLQLLKIQFNQNKTAIRKGALSFFESTLIQFGMLLSMLETSKLACLCVFLTGLFICFAGRRFFRASIGFVTGGLSAFYASLALEKFEIVTDKMHVCAVLFVAFLVGAFVGVYVYKIGLFAVGLCTGILSVCFIRQLARAGYDVDNFTGVPLYVAYAIGALIVLGCIALAYKLESVVAVFATSGLGALLTVCALDCVFQFGIVAELQKDVQNYINNSDDLGQLLNFTALGRSTSFYALVAALAISGAVVQFLCMRKKCSKH